MNFRTYYIIIFLMIYSSLAGQDLNTYLETAAENNPGLKASFNKYMAALEKVPQAGALPDPQIAFAYFISPVETRMGPQRMRLSASQYFPWFGTLEAMENMAAENAKARFEIFKEERSRLFYDVKARYYTLYFYDRSINITKESIGLMKSLHDLVNIKVQSGSASLIDEYSLEMEINELIDHLAFLDDRYKLEESLFRNLLNTDINVSIQLPDNIVIREYYLSKEASLDSIMTNSPRLFELDYRNSALMHRKETVRLNGMPDLKIGMDYTIIGAGENNLEGKDAFIFPSVGISIPLFREKYRAMEREVGYLLEANANESEAMKDMLTDIFEETWKKYLDADRRIKLNIDQARLAEKSLVLMESEYENSEIDLEEFLRMERKYLEYKLGLAKAITDKMSSIAFLNYLMGK